MSGHPRTSLPAVEEAEMHVDELHGYFARDGVIDVQEQAHLDRAGRVLFYTYRTDGVVDLISTLTRGKGVDSPWLLRRLQELQQDRRRLQAPAGLRPDDDPSGGAACAVPPAMDEAA